MSSSSDNQNHAPWALFLDIDGTLLELAETPDAVRVPEGLNDVLRALCVQLEGALALVSGRTLQDIDKLLAPCRWTAAGLHGAERRDGSGCVHAAPRAAPSLDAARERLERFVALHSGLLLEQKHAGIAVHFRRAPDLEAEAERAVAAALELAGEEFVLQRGKCVLEIRPRAFNKGLAVARFMREAPFSGRCPIYVGDDLTDEDAFAAVNSLQGISIRVGSPAQTLARFRIEEVAQVNAWLAAAAADANGLSDFLRFARPQAPA